MTDTVLQRVRDKGNTVLVMEHQPDAIEIADHVVDTPGNEPMRRACEPPVRCRAWEPVPRGRTR